MKKLSGLPAVVLAVGAFLALAVITASAFFIFYSAETKTISGPVYVCVGESTSTFPDGAKLRHTKQGTTFTSDDETQDLSDYILYCENEDTAVMQTSMLWNQRSASGQECISYFAEVSFEGGTAVIRDGQKTYDSAAGFLYNGEDTYLFLEPCTLAVNGKTVELGAMSSVRAVYNQQLEVYSYSDKSCMQLDTSDSGAQVIFSDGSGVNVNTDTFMLKNGSWYLLITNPERLL